MTTTYRYLLTFCLMAFLSACQQATPPGYKVVQIIDGDTLLIQMPDGKTERKDLLWVDAPEREQPFGREAKTWLRNKVFEKSVNFTQDGEIILQGENINLLMLREGFAWLAPQQLNYELQLAYSEAQNEAMNSGKGLWGQAHALRIPPWVWREQGKQKKANPMPRQPG